MSCKKGIYLIPVFFNYGNEIIQFLVAKFNVYYFGGHPFNN